MEVSSTTSSDCEPPRAKQPKLTDYEETDQQVAAHVSSPDVDSSSPSESKLCLGSSGDSGSNITVASTTEICKGDLNVSSLKTENTETGYVCNIDSKNGGKGNKAHETEGKGNETIRGEHSEGRGLELPSVREEDVGITEYISQHEGFSGVIKQRYSDFLVNEIDTSGQINHLTDVGVPQCDAQAQETASSVDVIPEDVQGKLRNLEESKDKAGSVIWEVGDDKEKRTQVHRAIRENFSGLESSTVEEEGKKCIKVVLQQQARASRGGRSRPVWPKGQGEYCTFVLYKENKDTMEAVNQLARLTRINPGLFSYGGTKDRRAKTCQLVSVHRVTATRLHQLNKCLNAKNMAVGNFRYCKEALKLGDLKGNHFVIVLRNVTGALSQIEEAMASLQKQGFINYYGMQRFGTTACPTHHVGRALLQGRWEEAVELILKPRSGDDDGAASYRQVWWETRDANAALKQLVQNQAQRSGGQHIERQLLQGLVKANKNDWVNALANIPRNTRLMYIHSYQSYIWNTLVSRRVRQFGLRPMIGDLVLQPSHSEQEHGKDIKPEVLTADTVAKHDIHDVVMPLPGYDVIYPDNQVGEWFREMLAQDELDDEKLRNKVKDYSLPGAYRKVLVLPANVTWSLLTYDDVTLPLVESDWDVLSSRQLPQALTDGKFQALKLEFSLPSSTYATMAIREVLKTDTSSAHQSTLNVT